MRDIYAAYGGVVGGKGVERRDWRVIGELWEAFRSHYRHWSRCTSCSSAEGVAEAVIVVAAVLVFVVIIVAVVPFLLFLFLFLFLLLFLLLWSLLPRCKCYWEHQSSFKLELISNGVDQQHFTIWSSFRPSIHSLALIQTYFSTYLWNICSVDLNSTSALFQSVISFLGQRHYRHYEQYSPAME